MQHGANCKLCCLHEMQGCAVEGGFPYDITEIKCPTFIYHEVKGEVPLASAEINRDLIPGGELIVLPEHGHTSMIMEFERIVLAAVQGKSVQSRFKNTNPYTQGWSG